MLSFSAVGLDNAVDTLECVKDMSTLVYGAQLRMNSRSDGSNFNNAEIAAQLIKDHRDFFNISSAEIKSIEKAFASAVQDAMDASRIKKGKGKKFASIAYTESMKMYMDIVKRHILTGTSAKGGIRDLSEKYKKDKQREFGFVYPIGVATRQLLENFDTPNYRNIEIIE
jgi:hypothetical protein